MDDKDMVVTLPSRIQIDGQGVWVTKEEAESYREETAQKIADWILERAPRSQAEDVLVGLAVRIKRGEWR